MLVNNTSYKTYKFNEDGIPIIDIEINKKTSKTDVLKILDWFNRSKQEVVILCDSNQHYKNLKNCSDTFRSSSRYYNYNFIVIKRDDVIYLINPAIIKKHTVDKLKNVTKYDILSLSVRPTIKGVRRHYNNLLNKK